MQARAAVTINRSQDEVSSHWNEVEAPASGEGAVVSYAPAPGGRGTEVRVVLEKNVTGGVVGEKVAAIAGKDPQRQLEDALRRFKQLLETGEITRSDGSPGGTDATQLRKQREAQPIDASD